MTIINSSIHRLMHFPLNYVAFQREIEQIENIAVINGLKVNVRQVVKRKLSISRRNFSHRKLSFPTQQQEKKNQIG